jgi:alpha-L-rhamnosidase
MISPSISRLSSDTKFRFRASLIAAIALGTISPGIAQSALTTLRLRCEYLESPLGLDEEIPRLSWIVTSDQRGERQTAYQLLVASSSERLAADDGDLWNSGRVDSDQTNQVEYGGKPLASRQRAWWKVRAWDSDGQPSQWSEPASWEMGQLTPSDWQAKWIGRNTSVDPQPLPLVRREFMLNAGIKRARVYVCGLGYYELTINGKRIGDHRLDPGYTRYDRRLLYVTYDVTDAIHQGENAIGVMLGNGWYNVQTAAAWDFDAAPWRAAPKLLLELHLEMADGSTQVVRTDEQWKTADGPIVFNSIYGGETYDARVEQPGWTQPDFDDAAWQAAEVVDAPKGKLTAQAMHPIKITQWIKPVSVSEPRPGVFVFDVGQNLAGFAELKVAGPAGTKVVMKYSELLDKEGLADQSNIGVHVWKKGKDQQFQTDTYVLKGDGEETWHARFDYHGFQYVEVTGSPEPLSVDNLRVAFMHSAVPEVGHFKCSNPLLNQIARNAKWSYLSNLHGIPTDCPHREKNGWTGDAHLACEVGLWNFDAVTHYEKWIHDLADEQQADGKLPGIVPTSGWGYHWGNGPAWDSAYVLIPDYLQLYCGDTRLREREYEGHKRYVDYLTRRSENGIVKIGLGDWSPAKTKTPEAVTSTAYYYRDARIVAATARMLGRDDEARKYDDLADGIRDAFNRKFYSPATGSYANGSQTALSCALYQGLVEPAHESLVVDNLLRDLDRTDGHIDTGILGAKYLLHALSDRGHADAAYRIAAQDTQPSWGWWIRQGATTLWEGWGSGASHNHIFYGDVVNWYYRTIAGINPDPAAPGFKHIIIKPQVVGDLTWAKATYDSVRGPISSQWSLNEGLLRLNVVVPTNTTATVYLPTIDATTICENGHPLEQTPYVQLKGVENGRAVLEVGSGNFDFASTME